jgi:glycosyltransferase involved in cell wall biosynthesis
MTPERAKRLITVTQYSTIKGPGFIAAAVEQAMAVDPDIELTWVCDVRHHVTVRQLFRLEFQPRVRLCAWKEQDALLSLLDQHGIFVAHSVYEGAAKACTEAMARGLAVVSSAVGALKDHSRDSQCLHLVPVGDVPKMAEILVALAADFLMVKETGAHAIAAINALRWRRCAEDLVRFYRTLAAC